MSDSAGRCIHCGREEEEHDYHVFEDKTMPPGCCCAPEDYGTFVPKICPHFSPHAEDKTICSTCEHDKECHR